MFFRIVRAAIAGALAWWAGLMFLFGSAQSILAHPALQSAKLNAIYELQPPARIAADPWLLPLGILVVATVHSVVFAYIRPALPKSLLKRGLAFGAVSWAMMVPWFEFYLPWNLMLEPTLLVMLEMLIWVGVMVLVGSSIALAFGRDGGCHLAERLG